MSKKIIVILVVLVAVVGVVGLIRNLTKSRVPAETKGKLVIAATGAPPAPSPQVPKIEAVILSTDKIEVQKQNGSWVAVFTVPLQIDLMNLNQTKAFGLLGQGFIDPGIYDQIRLHVMNVTVKQTNVAPVIVQLPSNNFTILGKAVVEVKKTSVVTLDFLLDKSLHKTGTGKFILTPVVSLESRSNANVIVGTNNTVEIKSGQIEDTKNEGMDLDGNFKADFMVSSNIDLVGGKIQVISK